MISARSLSHLHNLICENDDSKWKHNFMFHEENGRTGAELNENFPQVHCISFIEFYMSCQMLTRKVLKTRFPWITETI